MAVAAGLAVSCAALDPEARGRAEDARIQAELIERQKAEAAAQQAQFDQARQTIEERERAKTQAEQERKAAEKRQFEADCAETRPKRLDAVRAAVVAWQARRKTLRPHAEWVLKHCKVEDTRGTLVQRERTKDGVIVRLRAVGREDEIRCDAARPAGVSAEDAEFIVTIDLSESIYDGEHAAKNIRCEELDRAAGVNLLVTFEDPEGQKALFAR